MTDDIEFLKQQNAALMQERQVLIDTKRDQIEALQACAEAAEAEVKRLTTLAADRRYFMEAYRAMLGPTGLTVANMWDAKRVKRVHHSWGPDAAELSGEERAQLILDWEEAARDAVPVERIDF